MAQRYLTEGIDKLSSPIVKKIKEIISDFIHNKCRALEFRVTERVKEEKSCIATTTSWTCQVCGKHNSETAEEKLRACVVCGRKRNYLGSKKTQQLNKLRIDPTPLSTIASKQCLREAQKSNKRSSCPAPHTNIFATKADYEEVQRCEIKSEINEVLESVRSIMDGIEE
jgi:predicted  nucleic acid-binding Zn-ribbon protein